MYHIFLSTFCPPFVHRLSILSTWTKILSMFCPCYKRFVDVLSTWTKLLRGTKLNALLYMPFYDQSSLSIKHISYIVQFLRAICDGVLDKLRPLATSCLLKVANTYSRTVRRQYVDYQYIRICICGQFAGRSSENYY